MLALAEVKKNRIASGAEPANESAADFGHFVGAEQAKRAKLVRDAGIAME